MIAKTIPIPTEHAAHAAQLHQLLLAPLAFRWSLSCPTVAGRSGLATPTPRLHIEKQPGREPPAWLSPFESFELTATPQGPLTRILRGLDSLSLGEISVQLVRSLSRETLSSEQVIAGVLPLPEMRVLLSGYPDPTTVCLTAEPSRSSFLLRLRTLLRVEFDVRLTF